MEKAPGREPFLLGIIRLSGYPEGRGYSGLLTLFRIWTNRMARWEEVISSSL